MSCWKDAGERCEEGTWVTQEVCTQTADSNTHGEWTFRSSYPIEFLTPYHLNGCYLLLKRMQTQFRKPWPPMQFTKRGSLDDKDSKLHFVVSCGHRIERLLSPKALQSTQIWGVVVVVVCVRVCWWQRGTMKAAYFTGSAYGPAGAPHARALGMRSGCITPMKMKRWCELSTLRFQHPPQWSVRRNLSPLRHQVGGLGGSRWS